MHQKGCIINVQPKYIYIFLKEDTMAAMSHIILKNKTAEHALWKQQKRSTWKPGENKWGKFIIASRSPFIAVHNSKAGPHIIPVKNSIKQICPNLFLFSKGFKNQLICLCLKPIILPLLHIRPKLLRPLDFPETIEKNTTYQ